MEKLRMNKEQLIQNCITVLGGGRDKAMIELLVQSAFAFVNSYTFQDYSLDKIDKIPEAIFFAVMDLVKIKHTQKLGIASERLSDLTMVYTNEEVPNAVKVLLDRYRIINVV
nr:MAG TPA: PORTAL PROTEIN, 15 PROTEIN, HEAD PROTEIN, VIRAL INFECTION, TAILED.2A [Caudoviricetes sp.]